MSTIDVEEARRFLAVLGDAVHTFQTFPDNKAGQKGLTRILHGTLDAHAATLTRLNGQGAGIFVTVNQTDGKGRAAVNITRPRALFVDLDGAPLEPVLAAPIAPRIVVESSPGKWHAYWPTVDIPPEQFSTAQKALATRYSADPKVCDLPRVMRLPGFQHRKRAPFVTRLIECRNEPLTWHEMSEAFALPRRLVLSNTIPEGERNATLFKLAKSLASKGVPQAEQLKRMRTVNATRCKPPLPEPELQQISDSAYTAVLEDTVAIPLQVIEGEAYKGLSDGGRTLVLLAYRRLDSFNNGRLSLAWSECVPWFPRKNTFQRIRQEVVNSGLLQIAKPATQPSKGKRPTAAFYRLTIGAKSAPYRDQLIGAKSAPLEALQALADRDVVVLSFRADHNSGEILIGRKQ